METYLTPSQLVIMNLMAGNRDPVAFDRPEEYLPERWLEGRKGRTDMPGQSGEKLGVTHLTYGCGRRVCPGIDSTYLICLPAAFVVTIGN